MRDALRSRELIVTVNSRLYERGYQRQDKTRSAGAFYQVEVNLAEVMDPTCIGNN